VFVNRGTGTAVGYDTRFSFNAPNQFLIGNGQPFLINTATCGLQNIATSTNGRRPLLSNPSGASVAIDGSKAPGAVVSTFDITGSATGIYATGNLSSGLRRTGPARPITSASATGDSVVMNVTVNGSGAGQTGVFLDGGKSGTGLPTASPLDGTITFYNTAITNTSLFGMRVSGDSTAAFVANYNGSIKTSAAENVLLIDNMTGGQVNVAVGTAPAGSTVPNEVTATGGGGIRLLSNTDNTAINVDNVSLANTSGDAILVEDDNAVTLIRAGNGTGISRAATGAAVSVVGGGPQFTYAGPITNARAAGSTSPSYLLSVEGANVNARINLLSPTGKPFTDSGDGILVSAAAAGSEITVLGATINSSGATGILASQSSGSLDFRNISISGASVAGVSLLENQAGLSANFTGLNIALSGPNAAGFLASSNTGANFNINVLGAANTIATASSSSPAVTIEAAPANGAAAMNMTFATISSGEAAGSASALEFGPSTSGVFTITGSFLVGGGTVQGTTADITNAGGATGPNPPPYHNQSVYQYDMP